MNEHMHRREDSGVRRGLFLFSSPFFFFPGSSCRMVCVTTSSEAELEWSRKPAGGTLFFPFFPLSSSPPNERASPKVRLIVEDKNDGGETVARNYAPSFLSPPLFSGQAVRGWSKSVKILEDQVVSPRPGPLFSPLPSSLFPPFFLAATL